MAMPAVSLATVFVFLPFVVLLCMYIHFRLIGSKYWSKRKIPHLEPIFFLGNMWKANVFENFLEILAKMHVENRKKKIVGFWLFSKPNLLVMDVELTKRMLIKDFNNFRDRGVEVDVDRDPLAGHLFMLSGKQWRNLRVKLTPTFTSGKMKMMFPTMMKCGKELQEYLTTAARNKEEIEVKDLMARYATDVISSCAFGIETNSLQNPESEFREYGKKIFAPSLRTALIDIFVFVYPKIGRLLKFRIVPKDVSDFFIGVVRDTVEYREKTQTTRNDFLQLLIQLMRAGKIEDVDKTPLDGMDDEEIVRKFSLHEAAAQCFIFFFAGFETSSVALMFALYELALNPEIQKKLQREIDETMAKCNGDFTYDLLCGMEYLDMVVQETLRKFPPASSLMRKCEKDYYIPELDVTIDKDTPINFSVTGIHNDPDNYPDPDRFDPERFSAEEKAKRDSCTFLTFGEGPRNCIGNRFALMQIKIALLSVLEAYTVEVCKSTPIPVKLDVRSFTPTPVGGMPLVFTKRG